MELRNPAPSSPDLDGNPGYGRNSETAARDLEATGLSASALSPGDPEQPDSTLDWWRNRAVANFNAVAPQGSSWRSQRYRLAEDPKANVRRQEYFRAGVICPKQLRGDSEGTVLL